MDKDDGHIQYSIFKILTSPVMIMGADVNHPPADDRKGTPSLAAVVGSMDCFASNYAAQVRQQISCKEIIQDLKEMTRYAFLFVCTYECMFIHTHILLYLHYYVHIYIHTDTLLSFLFFVFRIIFFFTDSN